MNGQAARCRLVCDLINRCNFRAIFETGTYRATTTEWLTAFGIPIFSCELSLENFGFSLERLKGVPAVQLFQMNSIDALRHVLDGPLSSDLGKPILFYLDAHWNDYLPLSDEVDIIFSRCSDAVVLVDDFQVPDDLGYGYDNYGNSKALTIDYLAKNIATHDLTCSFPSTRSEAETGAKRGAVVITRRQSSTSSVVSDSPFLRSI